LALAKKPQVLLLDEPVAALDPLARRDFLQTLAQAVADTKLTVVMSSHLLADLELICDRVLILGGGRVQLSDDIEHVLETHRLLMGQRNTSAEADPAYVVIQATHTTRQSTLLVRVTDQAALCKTGWHISKVTIEDVVLAYMGQSMHLAKQPKTGGTR
jgi:ABC-2 type transport system ATP-binding protein